MLGLEIAEWVWYPFVLRWVGLGMGVWVWDFGEWVFEWLFMLFSLFFVMGFWNSWFVRAVVSFTLCRAVIVGFCPIGLLGAHMLVINPMLRRLESVNGCCLYRSFDYLLITPVSRIEKLNRKARASFVTILY